jgi:hypothetical protein
MGKPKRKDQGKPKNPAALAMSRLAAQALTPAQRIERARRAVAARWRKAKPPSAPQPDRWYGVFDVDGELLTYSRDKAELRRFYMAEERSCLIEQLDYDPRVVVGAKEPKPLKFKFERDAAAELKAEALLEGRGGQS